MLEAKAKDQGHRRYIFLTDGIYFFEEHVLQKKKGLQKLFQAISNS